MRRRAVITGMGLCTSLGNSRKEVVQAMRLGRTAFQTSPLRPDLVVCPILEEGDDEPSRRIASFRHRRYLSRAGHLSVLAGLRAAEDAGESALEEESPILATAAPTLDFEREKGLPPEDTLSLDALWLLRWLPNTANTVLSRMLRLHGEGTCLAAACASSLEALGTAWMRIQTGQDNSILVTAADSRLSSGGLAGYAKASALSRERNPLEASRPFDRRRSGFVPGEGGAAFVVEDLEHALSRKAHILCEILGYGASLDGASLTAPDPSGTFADRAVRKALRLAGVETDAVGWISAHGTGTPLNDNMEALVLQRIFGSAFVRPQVTALKSWVGHCSAACGAVELALMLSSIADGFLPCIRNLESPCTDALDFVVENTPIDSAGPSTGLLENFGFGGQNAALVVQPWLKSEKGPDR